MMNGQWNRSGSVSGTTTWFGSPVRLFLLIGARPHTEWLPAEIRRDQWGYVLTGRDLLDGAAQGSPWTAPRPPMLLETSAPGVFAAGDVRHRSIKRVASAVGEGSAVITLVHDYLAALEGR